MVLFVIYNRYLDKFNSIWGQVMFIDYTKKVCQYCGKEFGKNACKRTTEHIFPNGLVKLFPEQYIAFDCEKIFIDNKGATIADVCKKCNSEELSSIDSYGVQLIRKDFFKEISVDEKDNEFNIEFDYYKLSRWLLKVLYNSRRSKKKNNEWFHRALGFILYDIRIENIDFSIFAGVHINTNPLPEQFFEYMPLQINEEPKLIRNSLCISSFGIDPLINSVKVDNAFATYSVRFGTLILYIILWNKDTDRDVKMTYNRLMTRKFNFKQIISSKTGYELNRVSAHSNTYLGYAHLISKSGIEEDDMIISDSIHGQSLSETQKYFYESKGERGIAMTRAAVEKYQFPNNTRVQKKYEKFYGENS